MADAVIDEAPIVAVQPDIIAGRVKGRRPFALVIGIPAGVVAVWVGLAVLTNGNIVARVGLTIGGILAVLAGIAAIVDRVAGRRVDVDAGLLGGVAGDRDPVRHPRQPASAGRVTRSVEDLRHATRGCAPTCSPSTRSAPTSRRSTCSAVSSTAPGCRCGSGSIAVIIGMLAGGLIGMIAGYFRGKTDGFIGLLTDSLLAFPALILLLAVVSALDPTVTTISLVLALLTIPAYVRLARANTLVFAQREFVLAARSVGASHWRIIFRELAPNVVRPLLAYGSIIIAVLIVAEASLYVPRRRDPAADADVGQHDLQRADRAGDDAAPDLRARHRDVPHRARPQPRRRLGPRQVGSPPVQPLAPL